MANLYAREVIGIKEPRVGILSIGEEDEKGNELALEARTLIEKAPLNFCGNAEGRDLFNGRFDVIVCDGFVGNIVLKTVEGLVGNMFQTIMQECAGLEPAVRGKLGPVLGELQRRHDSEEYGGAPLLGVEGIVIICHGNSKARAICNALRVAATYADHQVNRMIVEDIARAGGHDE
jgi:glycerol-3-phosphate acyltransferase PlsX